MLAAIIKNGAFCELALVKSLVESKKHKHLENCFHLNILDKFYFIWIGNMVSWINQIKTTQKSMH